MNNGTKACLAFDDDIGDTHLAAKGRKENDKLDRVDIVSDDNERGLLSFDKSNRVVKAIFDEERFFGILTKTSVRLLWFR